MDNRNKINTPLRLLIDRQFFGKYLRMILWTLALTAAVLLILCLAALVFSSEPDFYKVVCSFFDSGSAWNRNCLDKSFNWLPIVNILGVILFGGLVISVITSAIMGQIGKIREGHIMYNLKNHIVVIGYNPLVPALVKKHVEEADRKLFVEIYTHLNIDEVRDKVYSLVEPESRNRVIFVHSLISSKTDLLNLHTESAKAIYVFGDQSENTHDSENMEILSLLSEIHHEKNVGKTIPLVMSFESESCFSALQLNNINGNWKECFEFIPYNYYCECADSLLMNRVNPVFPAEMFDFENKSDKHVHLVIIGMSRHGLALAKEAANLFHFSNFDEKTGRNASLVTFIDDHADEGMEFFGARYAGYFSIAGDPRNFYADADSEISFRKNCRPGSEFLDVRFRFIKGSSQNTNVRKWLSQQAMDPSQYLTVAVCTSEWSHNMSTGLFLPEELYYGGKTNPVRIFIRQESSDAMLKAINSDPATGGKYSNVYPYGLWKNCRIVDDEDMFVPMTIHYLFVNDGLKEKDKLPNLSAIPDDQVLKRMYDLWLSESKMWALWSNRYRAYFMMLWLQSFGYDMKRGGDFSFINPGRCADMAMVEHRRWVMERLFLGFRPINNEEKLYMDSLAADEGKKFKDDLKNRKFVHTLLIPNYQLPEPEKSKDEVIAKMPEVAEAFRRAFKIGGN